jgi:hypothetical protein
MLLQVFALGQAVTLLSPAGQAIGNSQAGLSNKTIHEAWKVKAFPKPSSEMPTVADFLQRENSQHPYARFRIELFTRSPDDIDPGSKACQDGAGDCFVDCLVGAQCSVAHRSSMSVASEMGYRKSKMRRRCEFCFRIAQ